ncbi:MAG: DUF1801 domain-containing protein [Bacteroidetes bacterium]|nr:DUF1801 domain-containing protein [Bacteroidota bacterium]
MSENKTKETKASVAAFVTKITDAKKRADFSTIMDLVAKSTKMEPKMWGTAIVGFGSYHYVYESGREGDAPLFGMAARSNSITFYLSSSFEKRDELLAKLGKHTSSKACIHIKKIEDIDTAILLKMVKSSMDHIRKMHK